MPFESFEDLDLYRAAREFRKEMYSLIRGLPLEEKHNLASQIRRAATSLTNNIAEGHGRFHYQEAIQFSRQSRGSLMELIDDLNLCLDQAYGESSHIEELKRRAYEINRMLNGYIAYLKKRKSENKMVE
jgi:four helix bundle protein